MRRYYSMKPYRITVADDDANMLFLLHKMLSRLFPNSSIASFSNAEDALSYILHTGADMLITDHAMGEMDGVELIRELRKRNPSIPIIMISGSAEAKEVALRAGATEFLEKHVDTKTMEACFRRLLHA